MSTPTCVYRSDHPSVMETNALHEAQHGAWCDAVTAFQSDYNGRALIGHYSSLKMVVGIGADDRPGAGWRRNKSDSVWVPDKRTAAGRVAHERMEALEIKSPRWPGMPSAARVGDNLCWHGFRPMDDAVWITWSATAEQVEASTFEKPGVDLTIWERARLSAYHLAIETAEPERSKS